MKRPRWPWTPKRHWVIGPDVPAAWVKLLTLTNVWDPYKRKAAFLFFLGMAVIVSFDIPGLFFTNPYTHIVEGPAAYLGILGAIVIGGLGFVTLWGIQFAKDTETMPFEFGAFNMRVRKYLRVGFHAIVGTIERVDDNLAERVQRILDQKLVEIRQLHKVQPINITPPNEQSTRQNPLATQQDTPQKTALPKLNLFYIPLPSLLAKTGVPGIMHLSTAEIPEQLHSPLSGEWIWEGWIRHGKGEIWDLGVCAEMPFLDENGRQGLVPITCAAGTYYDFTWGLERAINPPVLDTAIIERAKANTSARVGIEAVDQVVMYRDALQSERDLKPVFQELAAETAGNILELILQRNKIGMQPIKERKTRAGSYVGVAVIVATLTAITWLAFHGWHF